MSTTKKYISVNAADDTTNDTIKMQNPDNEVHGILYTKDSNDQQKDIRDIFVKKDALAGIEEIDVSEDADPGFNIETIAEKFNQMLNALKGTVPLILFLCGASMAFGANTDGKAKLRNIGANQYVVTNEVDGIYASDMKNATYGIKAGYGSRVDVPYLLNRWQSIAIGPYTSTTDYFPDEPNKYFVGGGYSVDFAGPTVAFRDSVAIGAGAQARSQVSVAIGVRAMTDGLHGTNGIYSSFRTANLVVRTVTDQTNAVVSVETNRLDDTIHTFDHGMYESVPYGREGYNTASNVTTVLDNGYKEKLTFLTQKWSAGQIDPRYATDEELYMYDLKFDPGQVDVNYKDAIYSVAMGYRAMCAGYHSLALGHYARTYRPSSIAAGPSTHVKSEGAVAFGYSSNIETNSPFSLAIGSRVLIDPCMTNAIVIGVPTVNYAKRYAEGYKESRSPHVYNSRPKAMKSNSINFVFNGDGLKDVFVDDVPMTDRIATEVQVVGNTSGGKGAQANIVHQVNEAVGLPQDDKSIVMVSGSGVKIFTEQYLDDIELATTENERKAAPHYGDVSQIEINGKKLSEILAECSNDAFDQYHATVTNAATIALESITTNTNF